MARHRLARRRFPALRRTRAPEPAAAPAPALADTAPTDLADLRATLEALPSQPTEVLLDYPDGTRLPVDCQYDGPTGTRERWIAVVPSHARVVNGMVIRVDRDTVLAVAVRDGLAPC